MLQIFRGARPTSGGYSPESPPPRGAATPNVFNVEKREKFNDIFSRFDMDYDCDGQTDKCTYCRETETGDFVASRGKNSIHWNFINNLCDRECLLTVIQSHLHVS